MKGLALVTGGNRGIGAAIASAMAQRGYAVKIVCRSSEKAGEFIDTARARGLDNIGFIEGDLGNIASIKTTAERIMRECPDPSVFIHNAGLWPVSCELNADGLEQSFVTNHLAPFINNVMLEDLFAKNRCKVVQVSAGLYVAGMKDYESAALGGNFTLMRTYATTKLFNLICTMMFARRWKDRGIRINAVHPGVVRTGLGEMKGIGGCILRMIKLLLLSTEKGALAPVMLADDARYNETTGRYFERFTEKKLKPVALDTAFNEGLWKQAMNLAFGISGI